jgi:hypothetical protein
LTEQRSTADNRIDSPGSGKTAAQNATEMFAQRRPILKARPALMGQFFANPLRKKTLAIAACRERLRLACQIGSEAGAVDYNAPKTFLISELA